jgi:hypothetical protein
MRGLERSGLLGVGAIGVDASQESTQPFVDRADGAQCGEKGDHCFSRVTVV